MEPALWQLVEAGSAGDEVGVIIRMQRGLEPPAPVRVVASFDDVFTARVRRGDIVALREMPGVISVKASTAVRPPLPLAESHEEEGDPVPIEAAAQGPQPSLPEDGSGVVVGLCDWGFDFTHPNFRNTDGTTRLLCLWDQRGFGDPRAPAPYNYGRLLTRDAIDAALRTSDPCAALGYDPSDADPGDIGSHATHVADILAGNRREPGSQVGLASGAHIVFVHLATPQLGELGNLGDSVGLLEGLDFCRRQAAGRPCVLHLSAGKTGGEKRGLSPLERAVDTMLKQPGIVLVQSCGNYANSAMHAQARVGPDQHYVLNWIIPPHDPTTNELEIWYSGEDVFDVTLISPNGREFTVPLDGRMRLEDDDTTWGNFYHRLHEPNSGLNHVAMYLYPPAPSGMWRIAIHGLDIVDGRLQAWIERDPQRRYQSHFLRSQASARYTTNTICNCFRAIAVGAHDATQRDRPATVFSSRGPTADGRQKPEISAPGYMIRAARSRPRNGWTGDDPKLCVKSGTSMAAPWVSGTVALMMQAAGRPLNVYEIRRALIGAVDPHPGPAGQTSTKIGYGYLNTPAAVAAARRFAQSDQSRSSSQAAESTPGEIRAAEGGWAPIWVEEAAGELALAFADTDGTPIPDVVESAEAIGELDDLEDAETEPVGFEDGAADIDDVAPVVWEDVRDAFDALADREELV
ncbi:MAG TPA: S8 family serine peptidase [Vicinamibacterales bacterium]|nr:S8 family serine peptidase [Vicinamibacterales bacterium]